MRQFPRAAILPAAGLDFAAGLRRARALGFSAVEVVARVERPPEHFEALADSGLVVACAAVGFELPPGHTLDVPSVDVRRATVGAMRRQLADAATLGATRAYLEPCTAARPDSL